MIEPRQILTAHDAARLSGISEVTVKLRLRNGDLYGRQNPINGRWEIKPDRFLEWLDKEWKRGRCLMYPNYKRRLYWWQRWQV